VEAIFQRALSGEAPLILVSQEFEQFGIISTDEMDCFAFHAVKNAPARSSHFFLCRDARLERLYDNHYMFLRESARPMRQNRVLLRIHACNYPLGLSPPIRIVLVVTWISLAHGACDHQSTLVVIARRTNSEVTCSPRLFAFL
jgi:hypothetical protein